MPAFVKPTTLKVPSTPPAFSHLPRNESNTPVGSALDNSASLNSNVTGNKGVRNNGIPRNSSIWYEDITNDPRIGGNPCISE